MSRDGNSFLEPFHSIHVDSLQILPKADSNVPAGPSLVSTNRQVPIRPKDEKVENDQRVLKSVERLNKKTEYVYTPFNDLTTIRVIELLPGIEGELICINLYPVSLDSDATFEALSYEWGIPFESKVPIENMMFTITLSQENKILCNGSHFFLVMKNLHNVLQKLRYEHKSRILWIDGICINQKDMNERSQQVMLMQRIYQQAKRVLCWIGDQKEDTEAAFRIIQTLADGCKIIVGPGEVDFSKLDMTTIRPRVSQDTIDELKGGRWEGVRDVYTRSYFGRIWVVQEIVMATSAVMICGRFQVSWHDFKNVASILATLGFVSNPDWNGGLTEKYPLQHRWQRVISLGELSDPLNIASRSLFSCLENLQGHEVTNPRDRVYGMLGMIVPQLPSTKDSPITPDYEKTVEDVYLDACSWMIKDLNSLKVLDLCDSPITNKSKKLPSWVPDLSKGPKKCARFLNRDYLPEDSISLPVFKNQMTGNIDGSILTVSALIFDTVTDFKFPFTEEQKLLNTLRLSLQYVLDVTPYPTGGTQIEALWRTLIGNTVFKAKLDGNIVQKFDVHRAPSSLGVHFMNFMAKAIFDELGLPLRLTGQEPDLRDLRVSDGWFHLDEWFPEEVKDNVSILALMARQPLVRLLYSSLKEGNYMDYSTQYATKHWLCDGDEGRQFITTAKGYMGVGPPCPPITRIDGRMHAKKGAGVEQRDVVAFLAGSDKVWILRGGEAGCYSIIGQAYLYGLSEGLCLDPMNLSHWKEIRII